MDCPDNHSLFFYLIHFKLTTETLIKMQPAGILRTQIGMGNKHFRKKIALTAVTLKKRCHYLFKKS